MVTKIEEILVRLKVYLSLSKTEKSLAVESFTKGERYFKKRDYEKALRYYKRAAKEDYPNSKDKMKECEDLLAQDNKAIIHTSSSGLEQAKVKHAARLKN